MANKLYVTNHLRNEIIKVITIIRRYHLTSFRMPTIRNRKQVLMSMW